MKLSSTLIPLAASICSVSAQAETNIGNIISQYRSIYGSNSAMDAWENYVSTHSFTTPSDLASWISAVQTATGANLESLYSELPTKEYSELMTQYYPDSILSSLTGYLDNNDAPYTSTPTDAISDSSNSRTTTRTRTSSVTGLGASTSARSTASTTGETGNGAASMNVGVGFVFGLSGLVAGLALF